MEGGYRGAVHLVVFASSVSAALGLMLVFSGRLEELIYLFMPLFLGGVVYALYVVSGEVEVSGAEKRGNSAPPTRSQVMFKELLLTKKEYAPLVALMYRSFLRYVGSVLGVDLRRGGARTSRLMMERGVDPEFVKRVTVDLARLSRGQMNIDRQEFLARFDELREHIGVFADRMDWSIMEPRGDRFGQKGA